MNNMQDDIKKIFEELKLLNEKTAILNQKQAKNKAHIIALKLRVAELEDPTAPVA